MNHIIKYILRELKGKNSIKKRVQNNPQTPLILPESLSYP